MNAAGAVLTGGASRRMGTDKALVEVGGTAMARRVATALAGAGCDPVWLQGGDADALAPLGLAVRPDTAPRQGPLPAITDALAALPDSCSGVVVAACDLPDLSADAVRAVLAAAGPDVPVVLAVDGAAQLVGWWPAGVGPALGALVGARVRSYRRALDRLGARLVEVPPAVVRNVNAPGDL